MVWAALAQAGIGLLGSKLAGGQDKKGALNAYNAGRTIIPDELRANLMEANRLGGNQLGIFDQLRNDQNNAIDLPSLAAMQAEESNRLQELRRPSIAQARADLQSQLLNRGRLGVGRGGGRTGAMFNPETAALEEAILQAQLGDIGAARNFAQGERQFQLDYQRGERAFGINEQQRALGNASGLFSSAGALIERPDPRLAAGMGVPNANRASTTRGFFSGLGSALGGSSFFGGGGGGVTAVNTDVGVFP